jgi:anti-sigma regulatory factor (Ser/Thr protein kinase)
MLQLPPMGFSASDADREANLPADVVSAAAARRLARAACRGAAPGLADTVELLVSEVVTNAVVHTRSGCCLRIRRLGPHRVRAEIHDRVREPPVVGSAPTDQADGRGLALVDALATRWGWVAGIAGGKTVWFEVERDGGA